MTDPSVCEACGIEFGCGAREGGCWCSDESVPPVTLADLRERYDRCLCPSCLRAAALVTPAPLAGSGPAPAEPRPSP